MRGAQGVLAAQQRANVAVVLFGGMIIALVAGLIYFTITSVTGPLEKLRQGTLIVGAGKLSHDVVAVMGGIEVHRRIPISLTFDHRAATGGEAARFLKALLDDMASPQ